MAQTLDMRKPQAAHSRKDAIVAAIMAAAAMGMAALIIVSA